MSNEWDEDEQHEDEDDLEDGAWEDEDDLPQRSGTVLPLAGGTLLTTEIVSLMVRGGWLGAGAGLLGSLFVYFKGQELIDVGKDLLQPAIEQWNLPKRPQKRMQLGSHRTFVDRVLGRFPNGSHEDDVEERAQPQRRRHSKKIVLSPELVLDRGQIIGKSIFVVGQRRSGKTTLGALLAEQIGAQQIPLFIPDSEGDLLSVYDLLPRGVIAAAPGSRWDDNEDVNLWTVTAEDADMLGFQILYEGMQVILDMASFEDQDTAWLVVAQVIHGLFAYAKEYPDNLCPVEVFLDEAQKYLPQTLSTSAIKDEQIRDLLLDAYKDCSGTGGKRGITPVILSQRFAETNNKIIAQSEVRFILRQTQDNDLERCMKYVRARTATPEHIANFQKGQGVYIGDDGMQLLTVFNQRQSDGRRSGTPTVDAVDRFANRPLRLRSPERTVIRKDQDAEDEVHAQHEQRQARPQREPLKMVPKVTPRKATESDALEVWNATAERIGRPRLQKELRARGLECSDYLAEKLLSWLLRQEQSAAGGDAVVGDE